MTIWGTVYIVQIMLTLQEKALLVKLFYQNQQNFVSVIKEFLRIKQIWRGLMSSYGRWYRNFKQSGNRPFFQIEDESKSQIQRLQGGHIFDAWRRDFFSSSIWKNALFLGCFKFLYNFPDGDIGPFHIYFIWRNFFIAKTKFCWLWQNSFTRSAF